jgi:hypothetical protein
LRTNRLIALNLASAALLSLALPSAAWAQTRTISVEAGPIWNQSDAERKCPEVAKARHLERPVADHGAWEYVGLRDSSTGLELRQRSTSANVRRAETSESRDAT